MARNKRSASAERAKKKRKVVLVKAQAAAERGTAASPKVARAKPAPIVGGTAGRIRDWLGHGRREAPRPGERVDLQAPRAAREEQEKPLVPVAKKAPVRTKPSPANTSKKGKCIPESDSECSSESRSSSSPSPSPIMAPAVVPAKAPKRPKGASPKKESRAKKRAAPALAPPAAKAKKANDGSSVKTKKAEAREAPVAKAKKPPEKAKPKPVPQPTAQPELSELDQMGLQDAVLERLRTLCDKDVDPKVLAEYIVVLAQMNKGPEHLSGELEAFFSDKALLQSFVRWVEDSKWTFVPGGPPKRSVPSKGAQVDFWGPAPESGMVRLAASAEAFSAGPKTVRQGPHVAVTSRVVLQPNPNFDSLPPKVVQSAPIIISSPVKSPVAKVAAPARPARSAESQQVQLLGDFTKTLQTILTKLQNTDLDDSQRERYQAMADKIHSKIKTIKLASSAGSVRRR